MLSDFVKYVKQYWHDRPDKSTPLNADRLNHIENGIASNSEAINQIANAVVSNIVNDPEKIASMAAVYALQEKLGTGELPSDAPNAISAINTLYSNLFPNNGRIPDGTDFNSLLTVGKYFVISNDETQTMTNIPEKMAGRLFVLNMLGDDKVLNKGYQYFIQIYLLYTGTLWTRSLTREADDSPIVFNNWVKRW